MDHGNGGDMPMTPMMPMAPDSGMYNNSMKMSDMAMHMSFFWGKDVTVLFPDWPNGHLGMYILALVFVFFVAAAVEALSSAAAVKTGGSAAVASLTHAAVYAVRMALAYMAMLSVMSFNLGIFIVAVAGHAVGFFLVKYQKLSAAARTSDRNGNNSSDVDPKV